MKNKVTRRCTEKYIFLMIGKWKVNEIKKVLLHEYCHFKQGKPDFDRFSREIVTGRFCGDIKSKEDLIKAARFWKVNLSEKEIEEIWRLLENLKLENIREITKRIAKLLGIGIITISLPDETERLLRDLTKKNLERKKVLFQA